MKQDTEPTTVIFRKYPGGDIIALFPYVIADSAGYFCQSYQHIGQHGGADYHAVLSQTQPARLSEYLDLGEELESIGYFLDIRRRRNHSKWREAYEENRRQLAGA